MALHNSITRFLKADQDAAVLMDHLNQELEIIREHAEREKLTRRGG